jgi:hypothetical protein
MKIKRLNHLHREELILLLEDVHNELDRNKQHIKDIRGKLRLANARIRDLRQKVKYQRNRILELYNISGKMGVKR